MKKTIVAICLTFVLALVGCQGSAANGVADSYVTPQGDFMATLDTFNVTSSSLNNGAWIKSVSNGGGNISPELSWTAVEGAGTYALYMIDVSVNNWIHMKYMVDSNSVEAGAIPAKANDVGFVGPYPAPGSTHTYVVYVIALKDSDVSRFSGILDSTNTKGINDIMKVLDETASGETGNVLAYGEIAGTYTAK